MIEDILQKYLSGKLDVPVCMEAPEESKESFVIIEKTGGGGSDRINTAVFAIQSYAGSLYEAAALNGKVKEAMESFADGNEVSRASLNTDYNFTDTESKRYRYQAVYDIVYY